jgi:hypothetical protein
MNESHTHTDTLTRRDVLKKSMAMALGAAALSATQQQDADAQVTQRELEAPLSGGATLLIGNFTDPTSPFPDLFLITDEQLDQFKLSEQEKAEVFRGLRFGAGTFSPLLVENAFNLGLDGRVANVEASESHMSEAASAPTLQTQNDAPKNEQTVAAQVDSDLIGPLVTVVSVGTVRREVERFITVMT